MQVFAEINLDFIQQQIHLTLLDQPCDIFLEAFLAQINAEGKHFVKKDFFALAISIIAQYFLYAQGRAVLKPKDKILFVL